MTLQELADRQAIYDQMCRYCQAIDRCDVEMLKSVFHPDATVDMGIFEGNAMEFAEYNIPFIEENLLMAWHRVSNVSIRLDGDCAVAESYMLGNAAAAGPDGDINCPDNMRYGDVWEKRGGEWKMLRRDLIMDWNAAWPYTGSDEGMYAAMKHRGCRGPADPAYSAGLVIK